MKATTVKVMKGWKVELFISWPARVRSTKLTAEAKEVFFTICTMKPTVPGVALRIA
jgi:hypothetical protein